MVGEFNLMENRMDINNVIDFEAIEWNLDPLYNLITDEFDCDDFLF
jgi:hypothetical protein